MSDATDELCSQGRHDWRINPFIVLPTYPPREEIVCANCKLTHSRARPARYGSPRYTDDPKGWPLA